MGYVYIDDAGALHRRGAGGSDDVIATDVAEAAVAPNGVRVAFIHAATDPDAIWGYDVGLRARYQLALDSAPVSALAWDPGGKRIAYLRQDVSGMNLRLRSLTGAAATTTLTGGDIVCWAAGLPDATTLVIAPAIPSTSATGVRHHACRVHSCAT